MPLLKCPECGLEFPQRRRDQEFCSVACNKAFETRALRRSRVVYRALYHWRGSRDNKQDLQFVCSEISRWIEADRMAGRGMPPRHKHRSDRGSVRKVLEDV